MPFPLCCLLVVTLLAALVAPHGAQAQDDDVGACAYDLTGDGAISTNDLLMILALFGRQSTTSATVAAADVSGDGIVGTSDLLGLLAVYGRSCGEAPAGPEAAAAAFAEVTFDPFTPLVAVSSAIYFDGGDLSAIESGQTLIRCATSLQAASCHPTRWCLSTMARDTTGASRGCSWLTTLSRTLTSRTALTTRGTCRTSHRSPRAFAQWHKFTNAEGCVRQNSCSQPEWTQGTVVLDENLMWQLFTKSQKFVASLIIPLDGLSDEEISPCSTQTHWKKTTGTCDLDTPLEGATLASLSAGHLMWTVPSASTARQWQTQRHSPVPHSPQSINTLRCTLPWVRSR
jgi:hypothetical protein